ncbi:PAS domain S-box protein [Candidatus Saccharibacteria bacterium CPR2]|nr:PAS domain S-box protein [Candidatus Saccharibacteria bacterium CPR2]
MGSVFFVSYLLLQFVFPGLQDQLNFGVTPGTAILGLITAIFGLFLYKYAVRLRFWVGAIISYSLLFSMVSWQIYATGGVGSPYIGLWYLIIMLTGMFGWAVLVPLIVGTDAYYLLFVLGIFTAHGDLRDNIIRVIMVQITFIASLIIWSNQGQKKTEKGSVEGLMSSLAHEKSKADILISAMADGVIVVDTDYKIKLFNPAAQEITGWKVEEALGLDYRSIMKFVDDKNKPLQVDPLIEVFQQKQPVSSNKFNLNSRSNKIVSLSITISPIQNFDNEANAVIVVFRDISQEKSEQQQRAEFISTASHEMRTPVAAIEGYLSLAMNPNVVNIDTKAREYLEKAHSSTQHLGKLFQDLLTAAKSEDGRLISHPKVTDISAFLEQVTQDVRFTAEKKGLKVEYQFGDDNMATSQQALMPVYYAHVDPDRLREIITNLFDNAVKYTEEGKIVIGLRADEQNVLVTVEDTGPGIPAEDIPHLFEKFYRVDNSATRQIGGTGLGLFICRKIVELFGGKIWVDSRLGKGSKFYVSLPRLSTQKAQDLMKREAASMSPLSDIEQSV